MCKNLLAPLINVIDVSSRNTEHIQRSHSNLHQENTAVIDILEKNILITTVTLSSDTAYSFEPKSGSTSPVNYNGSFFFKLIIYKNYESTKDFVVKVNEAAITADTDGVYTITGVQANQTVTVEGVVLKPADYRKVDEAIEKENALKSDDYTNFDAVTEAINAVDHNKNITEQ